MIGILAYGSLIDEPGFEIERLVHEIIDDVETPFTVEFARSSNSRNGAPTLVPVETGGATVCARIFVLESVTEREVKDLVYRREIHSVGSDISYRHPINPGEDSVVVEAISDFAGLTSVVYTRIASNLDDVTPGHLAELAIRSAREEGNSGRDGISYLIDAKRNGIVTPLMTEYEREILQRTEANSLEEARDLLVY